MSVSELLLVRHGESEGNVAAAQAHEADAHEIDVPARDPDVALSDLGREQAAAVGTVLGALPDNERPHALASRASPAMTSSPWVSRAIRAASGDGSTP